MTFEQFQATRTECPDIGAAIKTDMGVEFPVSGHLYMGELYIENVTKDWPPAALLSFAEGQGNYHLTIEREHYASHDLAELERKLYDWATANDFV